ncbi:hypothetical protein NQ317_018927 [Molorchus minor]|uniref:Uncharacterized protein n=1 Tax=Molorchus minor TaxID=1323400 RepID=A0ABQ9JBN3_9CUCU|nr:hypothetical protein NQ317_018927 [Molorchus minor]
MGSKVVDEYLSIANGPKRYLEDHYTYLSIFHLDYTIIIIICLIHKSQVENLEDLLKEKR